MLDYLLQYGLFLAEVTTVVIAIGVVIRFLFNAIRHAREYTAEHLEVKNLNRRFEQMADVLNHDLLNPHERKAHIKAKKKEYKQRTKEQKKGKIARSRVFVPEVAITRNLFADILRFIAELRQPPDAVPA